MEIFYFNDNFNKLERAEDLEIKHYAEDDTVPGYVLKCTDGHSYLVFAPDMSSLKHMNAYCKLIGMVDTYMSDHMYDPERMCIDCAWSETEVDEYGDRKVLHAPASEMGKIYIIE